MFKYSLSLTYGVIFRLKTKNSGMKKIVAFMSYITQAIPMVTVYGSGFETHIGVVVLLSFGYWIMTVLLLALLFFHIGKVLLRLRREERLSTSIPDLIVVKGNHFDTPFSFFHFVHDELFLWCLAESAEIVYVGCIVCVAAFWTNCPSKRQTGFRIRFVENVECILVKNLMLLFCIERPRERCNSFGHLLRHCYFNEFGIH